MAQTYGKELGKASVTGYCIRFKTLKDINVETLEAAVRYGFDGISPNGIIIVNYERDSDVKTGAPHIEENE